MKQPFTDKEKELFVKKVKILIDQKKRAGAAAPTGADAHPILFPLTYDEVARIVRECRNSVTSKDVFWEAYKKSRERGDGRPGKRAKKYYLEQGKEIDFDLILNDEILEEKVGFLELPPSPIPKYDPSEDATVGFAKAFGAVCQQLNDPSVKVMGSFLQVMASRKEERQKASLEAAQNKEKIAETEANIAEQQLRKEYAAAEIRKLQASQKQENDATSLAEQRLGALKKKFQDRSDFTQGALAAKKETVAEMRQNGAPEELIGKIENLFDEEIAKIWR